MCIIEMFNIGLFRSVHANVPPNFALKHSFETLCLRRTPGHFSGGKPELVCQKSGFVGFTPALLKNRHVIDKVCATGKAMAMAKACNVRSSVLMLIYSSASIGIAIYLPY